MNTLMLGLLFCATITILVWKYKRAAVDPMDFERTKVDSLKVGELLSILHCIGELKSILWVQENYGRSLKGRRVIVDPIVYRTTKVDLMSFERIKVDPLKVGELLSIR